ncbi:hypothetical protein ACI784_10715 [Geodermatophilus sp. SYSU D01186]
MTDGPDWVEQARRLVAGLGQTLGEAARTDAEGTGHHADCRWCPVCQVAAVVRGERPEVTAALADVLGTAAAALRSLAEQAPAASPSPSPSPPAAPADEPPAAPEPSAPEQTVPEHTVSEQTVPEPAAAVQRIEIA